MILSAAKKGFLLSLALSFVVTVVNSYSIIDPRPTSELLKIHESSIQKLKDEASNIVPSMEIEPYNNDVFFLRYCLASDGKATFYDDACALLKKNLQWRCSSNNDDGKVICDSALAAITSAQSGEGWSNEPVREAAPNCKTINQYLTPEQVITTSNEYGDLIYCIRASQIDDVSLMSKVSVTEMINFFLYVKEVHNIICNQRSMELDRLCGVIAINDLSGLKIIGSKSDPDFRTALSESSKKANKLFPNLAGPTLLVNLPPLVSALVKLFTPIFPKAVRKKIKFEQGPLSKVKSLTSISANNGSKDLPILLSQLNKILKD